MNFPALIRIYIASGKPKKNATSAKSTFQKISISVLIIAYIESKVNIYFNLIYQHKIPYSGAIIDIYERQ